MASYKSSSRERYRSPSPSSKRRKHDHYRERSSRSRSSSRDRSHRHRSSHRTSSHRSSRHYDDRYSSRRDTTRHASPRRHRDRSSSIEARNRSSTATTPTQTTPSKEETTTSTQETSNTATAASDTKAVDKDELTRQRLEKIERWKREQAAKKAAAEEEKKKQQEQQQQQEEEQRKAAQEKMDTTPDQSTTETTSQQQQQEEASSKETEKQWNLEDDKEDGAMEVDHDTSTDIGDFKPLKRSDNDDDESAKESFKPKPLLAQPSQPQRATFTFGSKQSTSKPSNGMMTLKTKTTGSSGGSGMRIGLGKGMMMGKASNAAAKTAKPKVVETKKQEDTAMEDTDVDPLEAYMMDVTAEARKINEEDKRRMQEMQSANESRMDVDEEEGREQAEDKDEEYGSDPEDILAMAAKRAKKKDLAAVDHSQMDYEPFRKNFYIEPPELREMTPDQVDMLRIELDGIKIRGVNCPKPIQKWTHCGLPAGCLEVIRRLKFEKPTSIQAQAIPAIMSGRDVIGVAKTGSGKTIAFLLPMFRHIKDQRPLEPGEGPVAVIMTPTRELATQIHRECKPFLKVLGLRAVCAYGGSPIKDQIADLKRGCEIIVCTPGRMIDLLCANSGRVTNLRRVTYLVLDEADRMFDMGFEPQVMKIVNNVRPSKQTVLFSATFPRQMEALARKVLKKPLEITVGGRSVVCSDVDQRVEVREDSTKFVRLLEILGQFFNDEGDEDARALIFVDRHEAADNLLRDLIRRGYPCQSLHGGKDQADRDSTIADFKSGVSNILIATSVAARGLDVKQLKLVVNYESPNHMEDYVHRVGRTGRAGNKGTAYTFITPDQDRYATDICKALKLSGQAVPADLQTLADQFQEKVKAGKERMASSGFGGKGLERLDKDRDLVKKIQKRAYGGEDMEESDEEELELESRIVSGEGKKETGAATSATSAAATPTATTTTTTTANASTAGAAAPIASEAANANDPVSAAARKAAEVAARINAMVGSSKATPQTTTTDDKKDEGNPVYAEEIVINDYPQKARWRVTNKEQISQITEVSGAAITTRGTFFPPGKQPGPNERKLYLFIEGDSELVVEKAKTEIKRILVEATVAQMEAEARTGGGGRYSVV
ncbi:hypothetical protein O0I10_000057 [Lichtheimia ornata]|uniref:RNA helicase n=1 Tax=Lichtheimia ornata TaxID=688661 RepID=A0AAD8DJI8_9FUNG|nr:uncharacterized protein O0I10_000057 [Lichtheimia ornata]KAJ8663783.1 hypothetical protein O0I10_000057 [Lichtheimia ornata]